MNEGHILLDAKKSRLAGDGSQAGRREVELRSRYQRPTVEVISLACEISAYAPDEEDWPPF